MNWDGIQVTLYTQWDAGTAFLVAPNNRHPEFKLSANPQKANSYLLSFKTGYMHDCWTSCSALDEVGTDDPPAVTNFPEITECDSSLQANTVTALAPVISALGEDETSIRRLEGKVTVPFQHVPTIDRVRMVYLPGVVPVSGGGAWEDLVVIVLAMSGGPVEEGGASGPPH
jgi:hypothetical protein